MPKIMHRVCGLPMASIVSDAVTSAGFSPILFVVSSDSEEMRSALGHGYLYAVQDRQLGTGHALMQAQAGVAGYDNIIVLNSDIPLITAETMKKLASAHAEAEATITALTAIVPDASGLGRVVRDDSGALASIVEHREADSRTLEIDEINVGAYCFQSEWLWRNLPHLPPSSSGEIYLTDLIERARCQGRRIESARLLDANEAVGVNTREQLAQAESLMRDRIRRYWMAHGVTLADPATTYIDCGAQIGIDTVILPNTHIQGNSSIGENCEIGPNSVVRDSIVGDRCQILASALDGATLETDIDVGPFSHIRPGSYIESEVHIGNFGEIKNSRVGRGAKSGHFSYIGDAQIGSGVNIGAGAITCNYDGENKNTVVIGDDVFIGCDTMIVAPVTIGDRSYTGVGAVVNRDVPPDAGAIGAPARIRRKRPDDIEHPPSME